jgi:hypothetical protein
MVSVLQVYNALKDLTNKEQKGFITPQVFNSFAALAQMNIYNELFTELVDAKRLGRQSFDPGRDKSVRKQRLEDLAFFIRRENLLFSDLSLLSKPSNLSKIVSLTVDAETNDSGQVEDRITCELVYDPEKMDRIVGSNLSAPTANFPVALISTKDIEIFPSDEVESAQLTYYAKPSSFDSSGAISLGSPFYDFEVVSFDGNDLELPTSSCRDFMLPPHYLTEIVMEMAKLLGVRLRDPNVLNFATLEEASE